MSHCARRMLIFTVIVLIGFLARLAVPMQAKVTAHCELDSLIEQLGSASFPEREAAGRRLLILGAAALEALEKVRAITADPEIRRRAEQVVQKIKSRFTHDDEITCLAFSPDRRHILSGREDRTLRLWEIETGAEIRRFEHADAVQSATFSRDGRYAVSGSGHYTSSRARDCTVRIWDLKSGEELHRLEGHQTKVHSVALSPDGRRVLSASAGIDYENDGTDKPVDCAVRLWDVETDEELRRFEDCAWRKHHYFKLDVAFSPDGRCGLSSIVKVAPPDRLVTETIVEKLADGSEKTHEVQRGVGGGDRGILLLWDLETGKELRRYAGHCGVISSLAFSPDGCCILSGSEGEIRLWEVSTGKELWHREHRCYNNTSICGVSFSPDGRRALSVARYSEKPRWDEERYKTLRLWDVATGKEVGSFAGYALIFQTVAFSRDGQTALTADVFKDPNNPNGCRRFFNVRQWALPR